MCVCACVFFCIVLLRKLIPRLWERKKIGRNDWEGRKRRKRRKERRRRKKRKEGQNKHGMEEGQLIEEEKQEKSRA